MITLTNRPYLGSRDYSLGLDHQLWGELEDCSQGIVVSIAAPLVRALPTAEVAVDLQSPWVTQIGKILGHRLAARNPPYCWPPPCSHV